MSNYRLSLWGCYIAGVAYGTLAGLYLGWVWFR